MAANTNVRLIAYNMKLGGSPDPAVWARVMPELAPDILFAQETRDPARSWLPALAQGKDAGGQSHLWRAVPGGRWGSALWVRAGKLTPLAVPEDFAGRVVAAVIEGRRWPCVGDSPVVAVSVHAPTRKGSSYVKEVHRILDFAVELADGRLLILAGDFNIAVGLRRPEQVPTLSRGETVLLTRLTEQLGLVPSWQTAHPDEVLARTLRWMHRIDSPPYHCDGIFIPAEWTPALRSCTVLEDAQWCALSDHNPVVAVLDSR